MRMLAIGVAATALAVSLMACQTSAPAAAQVTTGSANVVAAVADPARPAADKELDGDRKPADMLAFAGVTPGMRIAELIPGGGYMTRLFSKAIGPTGRLYALAGAPAAGRPPVLQAIVADAANYPNVQVITTDFVTVTTPELVDLVWTSQNYHDMHNPGRNLDLVAANRAIFAILKPGGTYIVLDHSSAAGVPFNAQLHRIDKEMVRREVLAAGFEFVSESTVLANPADPRTATVFDPSIRHKTDQFILKFRRPLR
jgi:predicted methyltransferase